MTLISHRYWNVFFLLHNIRNVKPKSTVLCGLSLAKLIVKVKKKQVKTSPAHLQLNTEHVRLRAAKRSIFHP